MTSFSELIDWIVDFPSWAWEFVRLYKSPPEWTYLHWLLVISTGFIVLERLLPARPQKTLRPAFGSDLIYLVFNGHFFYIFASGIFGVVESLARRGLEPLHLIPDRGILDGAHPFVQFAVYLVLADFVQWTIHNLLHRVPWLWRFHQVHHSVTTMDWAANFRFHWMELVVYKSLQYLPLLFLGGGEPLFAAYLFGTAWGHFNHSNVRIDIGPLAWIFNSPRMHMWHHDLSSEGGPAKNFGIVFSCWDWIFGTAYWPKDRPPKEIGFPGMEAMHEDFGRQFLWPLWRRRSSE